MRPASQPERAAACPYCCQCCNTSTCWYPQRWRLAGPRFIPTPLSPTCRVVPIHFWLVEVATLETRRAVLKGRVVTGRVGPQSLRTRECQRQQHSCCGGHSRTLHPTCPAWQVAVRGPGGGSGGHRPAIHPPAHSAPLSGLAGKPTCTSRYFHRPLTSPCTVRSAGQQPRRLPFSATSLCGRPTSHI